VPSTKEILHGERAEIENMIAALGAPLFVPAQTVTRVETSTKMLRILNESEENRSEGIATGDGSSFQHSYPSSKIFARSPTDVCPRTRQAIEKKQTIITIFFTGRKPIMLDILPKGGTFNQQYFVDYIFPILKRDNGNFRRRVPSATLGYIRTI
jgi:hypothetical protein